MNVDSLGRHHTAVSRTATLALKGQLDVSTWDDEELLRGKQRDKKGKFTGKPPKLIPAVCLQELVKRRFSRSFGIMAAALEDAAKQLITIVNKKHPDYEDTVRLKAIELLFARVVGKPKEHIAVDVTTEEKPWSRLVAESIVGIVGNEQQQKELEEGEVVEGEVLDDTAWYQEDEDKQIDSQEALEEGRSSTVIHVGDATAGKPPNRNRA
jgi:hypothetical protein